MYFGFQVNLFVFICKVVFVDVVDIIYYIYVYFFCSYLFDLEELVIWIEFLVMCLGVQVLYLFWVYVVGCQGECQVFVFVEVFVGEELFVDFGQVVIGGQYVVVFVVYVVDFDVVCCCWGDLYQFVGVVGIVCFWVQM